MMHPEAPVQGLYIHVPFCAQKCAYCAFYSHKTQGALVDRFVNALLRELQIVAADLQPRTTFFGGGTPSLLNLGQWRRIFEANRQRIKDPNVIRAGMKLIIP